METAGHIGACIHSACMWSVHVCLGVRRAAQRKLEQELGIPPSQVPLDDFHFLTRIYYKARSDATWGEHESACACIPCCLADVVAVDYIFFVQKDVTVTPNPIEVKSFRYVTQAELRDFLASAGACCLPFVLRRR